MSDSAGIRLAAFGRGKDNSEELRIAVREYEGKRYVDLRIYWRGREGDLLPGKKGVTLRARELDEAIAALQRARSILNGEQREITVSAAEVEDAF